MVRLITWIVWMELKDWIPILETMKLNSDSSCSCSCLWIYLRLRKKQQSS